MIQTKAFAWILAASLYIPLSAGAAVKILDAGSYVGTISPKVDPALAQSIARAMSQLPEIQSAQVRAGDSSVRFEIRRNAKLDMGRLNAAIESVAPGHSLTGPIPDYDPSLLPG